MKKNFVFAAFLLSLSGALFAQKQNAQMRRTETKEVKDFMDLRFGMFVHWGPVTLRGTEIGWSRNHQVPQNDYDSLYKEFDPVLFNADDWVKTAKEAGVKYLVITAKHHDGFCLWPTAFTDYNIAHTPFKKDVVGALAKACKQHGIKFCIYYTVLDWYDKNYPLHNDGKGEDKNADMGKFILYMKNQLKELVTNYDPYMIWFDGNWEKPWTQADGKEIYDYLKRLNPRLIINNRLGKNEHDKLTAESVGDYATPEQKIGALNMDFPWESCITICKQWAWKPNDAMKPLKECIQTLACTAGGNGNLLLNVGPMPDGRMELRQVKRLQEMGGWLQHYGESVYGTLGGPYVPDSVMAATRKQNRIFIHLFKNFSGQLNLAAVPNVQVVKAYWLKGIAVKFKQGEKGITLELPQILPDENDAVLVLEMNKNVEQANIIEK
ncbi:alpha-L-fucosidase [Niabella soli]|uniref:alpha-L-fucosidase n=1 Tax=Niabella soli DSM 19437 TaxID=929713 RepID=W0F879_9BACT|nr:alpha-L-fucosidase [Niabella soli]AHF18028.1 hypothetical protein NIASO_18995 [Niabella soli DSM 19437]